MSGRRTSNELPMIFDFRKSPWSKNTTELALAATTFNHSLATQEIDDDVECEPKHVHLQMRYQSENKPKRGMLILPRDDWISLINNQIFQKFYAQVWDYLPLTDGYNERIIKHLNPNSALSGPLVQNTILAQDPHEDEAIDKVDGDVPSKKQTMMMHEE